MKSVCLVLLCYILLETCHATAETAYEIDNKYTKRHYEVNRDYLKLQIQWEIVVFLVRILDGFSKDLSARSPK
jgi:hypothetical protein